MQCGSLMRTTEILVRARKAHPQFYWSWQDVDGGHMVWATNPETEEKHGLLIPSTTYAFKSQDMGYWTSVFAHVAERHA